jgi:hypothetical protein
VAPSADAVAFCPTAVESIPPASALAPHWNAPESGSEQNETPVGIAVLLAARWPSASVVTRKTSPLCALVLAAEVTPDMV